MNKEQIQNLIKELIEKISIKTESISIVDDNPKNIWFKVEVGEPSFFMQRDGEALHALNHIVHKIIEAKTPQINRDNRERDDSFRVLIDINDFQKRRVENIRTMTHMMSERARYFKSNIEIDPMSAFERRIVHEFLSESSDLKTESVGFGPTRRVVIKYVGSL